MTPARPRCAFQFRTCANNLCLVCQNIQLYSRQVCHKMSLFYSETLFLGRSCLERDPKSRHWPYGYHETRESKEYLVEGHGRQHSHALVSVIVGEMELDSTLNKKTHGFAAEPLLCVSGTSSTSMSGIFSAVGSLDFGCVGSSFSSGCQFFGCPPTLQSILAQLIGKHSQSALLRL